MIRKFLRSMALIGLINIFLFNGICMAADMELMDYFRGIAQKYTQEKGQLSLADCFDVTGYKWNIDRHTDQASGGIGNILIYGNPIGENSNWYCSGMAPFNDHEHVYKFSLLAPIMEEGYFSQFDFAGYLESYSIPYQVINDENVQRKLLGNINKADSLLYKISFPACDPIFVNYTNSNSADRSGTMRNRLFFTLLPSTFTAPVVHFSFDNLSVWDGRRSPNLLANEEFKALLSGLIGPNRSDFLYSAEYNMASTQITEENGALNLYVCKGHDGGAHAAYIFVYPDKKIIVCWRDSNGSDFYDYIFATGKKPLLVYSGKFRQFPTLSSTEARSFLGQMDNAD